MVLRNASLELVPVRCSHAEKLNANPAVFARQGCNIGNLDRLATSMIVDGEPPRVMTYGEFEHALTTDQDL